MSVRNIGHGNKVCCGGVAAVGYGPPTVMCLVACPDVRTSHSTKPKLTRVSHSLTYLTRLCSVPLVLRYLEFRELAYPFESPGS